MEFINQKWLLRSQNIMLSAYQKSKVGVGNVPLPRTQLGCLTLRLALASKAVHSRTAAWWLLSLQTEENHEHATCCLYVHMFLCMCVCMCVRMTVCVHMHTCMCADCDSVPQLLKSRVPELSCLFLSHPLWSTNRSCSLPFPALPGAWAHPITSPATQVALSLPWQMSPPLWSPDFCSCRLFSIQNPRGPKNRRQSNHSSDTLRHTPARLLPHSVTVRSLPLFPATAQHCQPLPHTHMRPPCGVLAASQGPSASPGVS